MVWVKRLHHDHIACCALRSTQTIPTQRAFVHILPSMPPSSRPCARPSQTKTCKYSIVVVTTKEDKSGSNFFRMSQWLPDPLSFTDFIIHSVRLDDAACVKGILII
ncbi:hypothetical protein ElyMa_002513600 [Elysia marginata]|uniref:Uncharacterized protein n=1 Tax=Elysia marginata TaxID=1093978 RepID=A0AAV4GUS1_9GAST|nr:hypothetical protein ElyMa_002513600 [Elysia marginata]